MPGVGVNAPRSDRAALGRNDRSAARREGLTDFPRTSKGGEGNDGDGRSGRRDAELFRSLSGQWWQWATSIPTTQNPVTDTSGAYCMIGQGGDIWFLAGSTTGKPAVRSCSVPEGVPLFFLVLNSVNVNTPECDQNNEEWSVEKLRSLVAPPIDGATGLSVLLDNRPIKAMRRVRSEPFVMVFPNDGLFGSCPTPGRPYSPAVDDGYYVLLHGLKEGTHHLGIRGTNANGFLVDVFYTLNVVKVNLKERN